MEVTTGALHIKRRGSRARSLQEIAGLTLALRPAEEGRSTGKANSASVRNGYLFSPFPPPWPDDAAPWDADLPDRPSILGTAAAIARVRAGKRTSSSTLLIRAGPLAEALAKLKQGWASTEKMTFQIPLGIACRSLAMLELTLVLCCCQGRACLV